jgi:hypothetical protein
MATNSLQLTWIVPSLLALAPAIAGLPSCSSSDSRPLATGFPSYDASSGDGPDLLDQNAPDGGDTSDDGGAPDDSQPQDDGSDALPDASPPGCDPAADWGPPTVISSLSTAQDDLFGAVTSDELTLAWIDASGQVHVADRASVSEAFADTDVITLPSDYQATDGVAVSPNGLSIVVGQTNHKGFAQLDRAARGQSFSRAPDTTPFQTVNIYAQTMVAAEWIGAPVWSADGSTFWYTVYYEGSYSFLYESMRAASDPWPVGNVTQFDAQFDPSVVVRKVTGASSDGRTLFFWEPATSTEVAASRYQGIWLQVASQGDRRGAQPNADCSRLYFSQAGAAGLDLFVAERK